MRQGSHMFKKALCVLGVFAAVGTQANALVIDGTGHVTDWGLSPQLSGATNSVNQVAGNRFFTLGNNYAPIDYPGVGKLPSGGEPWDLEEMHVRFNANSIQVLTVISSGVAFDAHGSTFRLGDLFIATGGQRYGVVTQSGNTGLGAGSVYLINSSSDYLKLRPGSDSYLGWSNLVQNDYGAPDTIENLAGPWAVANTISSSQLLGSATIATSTFNYGGVENGTTFVEYTFGNLTPEFVAALGGQSFTVQQTLSCGNDSIKVTGVVPEPASVMLVAMGLGVIGWRRRRVVD